MAAYVSCLKERVQHPWSSHTGHLSPRRQVTDAVTELICLGSMLQKSGSLVCQGVTNSWGKTLRGLNSPTHPAHTLVSRPCRRFILCMLRSMVAWHVMASAHSARNHPLSPSRSRSPSYQPKRRNHIDAWKLRHVPCYYFGVFAFDVQCCLLPWSPKGKWPLAYVCLCFCLCFHVFKQVSGPIKWQK